VNRNTVRLVAAVVVAWLAGALGGLALVPYAAFVFIFVAVLMLPTLVAFGDSDRLWKRYGQRRWRILMSRAERDRANYISGVILAEIHRRTDAATLSPASNTSNDRPRSVRCAAAASPTGPAPITTTGSPSCSACAAGTGAGCATAWSATSAALVSVGLVSVGPQQLAPAARASVLAVGSQRAPAWVAACAVPQHTLPSAAGSFVAAAVVRADPQQPVAAWGAGSAGVVWSLMAFFSKGR
jgi:hypothetical protein